MGSGSGQAVKYDQCAFAPFSSWTAAESYQGPIVIYCALKGSGANVFGLGRCFLTVARVWKGYSQKFLRLGHWGVSGEVASLQRIARSISGLPFARLFVSLGSFGTILVIEIPNSMVWCRKGDPFLVLSNLISYGIRPFYHLLHEFFMRLGANNVNKLDVAEWMCPLLCPWGRRRSCHPLCRSGHLFCGVLSIVSWEVSSIVVASFHLKDISILVRWIRYICLFRQFLLLTSWSVYLR